MVASIEAPQVIAKILSPLQKTAPNPCQPELPLGARAPYALQVGAARAVEQGHEIKRAESSEVVLSKG